MAVKKGNKIIGDLKEGRSVVPNEEQDKENEKREQAIHMDNVKYNISFNLTGTEIQQLETMAAQIGIRKGQVMSEMIKERFNSMEKDGKITPEVKEPTFAFIYNKYKDRKQFLIK